MWEPAFSDDSELGFLFRLRPCALLEVSVSTFFCFCGFRLVESCCVLSIVAVEISSFTFVVSEIGLEEPDMRGVHTIGLEEPDI
jgi:hypothetical protein